MIEVLVDLDENAYAILVGAGVRAELARIVSERVPTARSAAIVTQRSIMEQPWFASIDPGIPSTVHCVPDGDRAKSLGTLETLCRNLADAGITRADVIVAVGGGVVTDLAGFAAASFHRGMAYVNVATSLLAQVDAAIGGKTGVNLPEGKNLVGAFWQPEAVLCDVDTLGTLDAREWACGRGEMAKYAFLGAAQPDTSILELPLDEQVARCASIKAAVVAEDEREGGRRALLNYGHTLAHALEGSAAAGNALAGDPKGDIRHGEAVAVGLVYAALLARRLGRIDTDRVELHRRVVGGFDLAWALPSWANPAELMEYMARDKKALGDLTFVLDGPNGVEVLRGIGSDDVLATLADMAAAETGSS